MNKNRRDFLKAGVVGGAVVATAGVPVAAGAHEPFKASKPLDILILGGTGFIGPHMVREALRRGHSVTLFNRGRTNANLFPDLETIKGDRSGELIGLKDRYWDCVVDNSGYVPRHVENSARTLSANTAHYLFISTVSVYASYAEPGDEDAPLATIDDETVEEVTGETYGPLKALCEKRVATEIGKERMTILRPTYICGPGDHTDRFSYWPVRTLRGGEMLWPGSPDHTIQLIDVRDLANFTIDSLESNTVGIFNMVNPARSYTMGQLLEDSQAVSGQTVDALWADDAFIEKAQESITTQNWGAFPIWHPARGEYAGFSGISGERARAAGLHNRPERETVRGVLDWWKTLPEERQASLKAGLSEADETRLIGELKGAAAA